MSAAGTEIARLVISAASADPMLAAQLAAVVEPHLQRGLPAEPGWMTSHQAAAYLGYTLPALYKLTASREIPFEQAVPGAKCWFWRPDLDAWRRGQATLAASRLLPESRCGVRPCSLSDPQKAT